MTAPSRLVRIAALLVGTALFTIALGIDAATEMVLSPARLTVLVGAVLAALVQTVTACVLIAVSAHQRIAARRAADQEELHAAMLAATRAAMPVPAESAPAPRKRAARKPAARKAAS